MNNYQKVLTIIFTLVSGCYTDQTVAEQEFNRIVIYQQFENADFSFRITDKQAAEFLIWTNGRIRQRYQGKLDSQKIKGIEEKLIDLSPLYSESVQSNNTEMLIDRYDEFIILHNNTQSKGNRHLADKNLIDFLDYIKKSGTELPVVKTTGHYIFAYEITPLEALDDVQIALCPAAITKAVNFPYSPIIMENCQNLSSFLNQGDINVKQKGKYFRIIHFLGD